MDSTALTSQALSSIDIPVLLADFPQQGYTPEELLESVMHMAPDSVVILRNAETTAREAVRWARLGAYQCISEVNDAGEVTEVLESAILHAEGLSRPRRGSDEPWRRHLVGESDRMEEVARTIRLIAPRRCTVLITGETGTGKEMAARALHLASPRAHMPFVAINCGALPESLLEAELFGHTKGAFTGAVASRVGLFEQANKGTLFLDEIGELPVNLQAKLLRALQEREVQRIGSSEPVKVDVRIIAATNVNLKDKVRRGEFREDLYYRLDVGGIRMPALRERPSDIPLLVRHFVAKHCEAEQLPQRGISPELLSRLTQQNWPGNVRQLENAVELAIALSGEREDLLPTDFRLSSPTRRNVVSIASSEKPSERVQLDAALNRLERTMIEQALRDAGGNKTVAADLLGVKRTTLLAKLRTLGIEEYAATA